MMRDIEVAPAGTGLGQDRQFFFTMTFGQERALFEARHGPPERKPRRCD